MPIWLSVSLVIQTQISPGLLRYSRLKGIANRRSWGMVSSKNAVIWRWMWPPQSTTWCFHAAGAYMTALSLANRKSRSRWFPIISIDSFSFISHSVSVPSSTLSISLIFFQRRHPLPVSPADVERLFYLRFPAQVKTALCFFNLSTTGNTMTDAKPIWTRLPGTDVIGTSQLP